MNNVLCIFLMKNWKVIQNTTFWQHLPSLITKAITFYPLSNKSYQPSDPCVRYFFLLSFLNWFDARNNGIPLKVWSWSKKSKRILALLEQCQKFFPRRTGRVVTLADDGRTDGRCLATFRFSFRSVRGGRARAKQSSTGWCCARSLQEQLGAESAVECNLSGGAHIGRVRDLVPTIPWLIISIILTKVAQVLNQQNPD